MDKQATFAALLLDDSFQAWVLSDGKEYALHWQRWLNDHPDQTEVLERAKKYLLLLEEEKYQLPEERKEIMRQKLIYLVHSDQAPEAEVDRQSRTQRLRPGMPAIAAAVVMLLALSWFVYRFLDQQPREVQHSTAFGEIKTIVLPDSTKVTLNGNSALRYRYRSSEEKMREVWLSGEGFFDVVHLNATAEEGTKQAIKFIVHTDNLSIQVLGTRFNVKHRNEKTQVVLEKGSIQLDIEERTDALLMQPDEMVEVKKGEEVINQKVVRADEYIAWKEGIIHLEGASFEEISSVLKDNYGLVLQFENPKDAGLINLRGSFPTQNIDILLEAIANVTHTTMKKKGKTIIYQ
ncbi:FecR family protein [Catalinimonas niigatensis]|uniref:FecR family protein n=1 Tax=Catalinimonas niigatensis TaxID=1397264 RepID=UPI002665E872|nr:FecR domain-containing protein [Catalinimonas niigatensis]WPP51477.1 FecR domain-containing protein [Catalinimonas niigatensis]